MDVKFCTNSINMGKSVSFDALIEKIASGKEDMVKTAEIASPQDMDVEESGHPQAEAKLVNEPKEPEEVKEASDEVADETPKAEEATEEVVDDATAEKTDKEASADEEDGEEEAEEEDTKEASSKKFVKIAKMNSETRAFLSDYYGSYFPKEFVDALLADYS